MLKNLKEKFGKKFSRKKILSIAIFTVAIIATIIAIVVNQTSEQSSKKKVIGDSELARAMTYNQFEDGDEAVDGTDNVKFSAFFLRDVNNDGYAEKIKGTCKQIGKEDTLYMEVNVQTDGILKNGKIEIDGKNFYLTTATPKDNELKDNYISTNTHVMEFTDLNNGTQKLLTGMVRSGEYSMNNDKISAIGSNINNLSRNDNKIIFTGIYVDSDNNEIEIRKEIEFTVDWYGLTSASLEAESSDHYDLNSRKDEANNNIVFDVDIKAEETKGLLNISRNYVEGTVPQLNGCDPISVSTSSPISLFDYDETNRKFVLIRDAKVDEEGNIVSSISKKNHYQITITYPLDAYKITNSKIVTLQIPVITYFEGFNNQNSEFENPYRSRTAKTTLLWEFRNLDGFSINYNIDVGQYTTSPTPRYGISKQKPLKIYNGLSEKEEDDTYRVEWYVAKGPESNSVGVTIKEAENGVERVSDKFVKTDASMESMENLTANVGIGFSNADDFLKEDGWIKVYDDETDNLLVTFTKDNWNEYTYDLLYKFELPVKHIRVETSETQGLQYLYVYLLKELDDDYITSNYTREQFDEIQYIQSQISVYEGDKFAGTMSRNAKYEAPISIANLSLSKTALSTQVTEKNLKITIEAITDKSQNQISWMNGSFLLKIPQDIIITEKNEVTINNSNVEISTCEYFENENGKFIKINTKNKTNVAQDFDITLDVNMTPDPRISTKTENIELYASNEESVDYYNGVSDIYDVNGNLNIKEKVHWTTVQVSLIAPNTLLTNQIMSNFDEEGTIVVSPQIADVKPALASTEEKEVRIGAQIRNNYSGTISEIKMLGKIPFEGNTYVVSGGDLKSSFSTKMIEGGLEVPEKLQGKVKVYYSQKENPTRDLTNEDNNWRTADQIENWDDIKTYLIDFEDEVLSAGEEYTFYYTVKIPNGLAYNQITYSHHGVYFILNTPEGKYRGQTEPNKIGIRIVKKYSLEIQKNQKGKENLVPGATYMVTEEADEDGNAKVKTVVTNEKGIAELTNLYAEKKYTIEEVKAPNNYELNNEKITFIVHVKDDGSLEPEIFDGITDDKLYLEEDNNNNYKVVVKVEDEVKAKLRIKKNEKGTTLQLKDVRYKLTGEGLPQNGKGAVTDVNGEFDISGLKIGKEYTLEEIKAVGYYLTSPIKFIITNEDGVYNINVTDGTTKGVNITEEDNIPVINMEVEDEKIPTYDLEISKIKKVTSVTGGQDGNQQEDTVYLQGAKFKLYKGTKEIGSYITNENGKLTINNLYQYIDGKDEEAVYMLKEITTPDGYVKVKDISFKVDGSTGELKFIDTEGKDEKYTVDGNIVKLTIEDSPSFKLIKKDAETGERLAGIKFAIYDVEKGKNPAKNNKGEIIGTKENINGKEYYTVTTDNNGELMVDLPEGMYEADEVSAPDKYDISDSTYYFGVGASREGKTGLKATDSKVIGGSEDDYLKNIINTADGGYIVGGEFSDSIVLENGTKVTSNGKSDIILIKYSSNEEIEWVKTIGGDDDEKIESISETSDGGYILGGYFFSDELELDNGIVLDCSARSDGLVIKMSSDGIAEWAKKIGNIKGSGLIDSDRVYSVSEMSDGSYIVGGYFASGPILDLDNGVTVNKVGPYTGLVVKYSSDGKTIWAKAIGTTSSTKTVYGTTDNGCIVGCEFLEKSITLENGMTFTNKSSWLLREDVLLIKYNSNGEIEWVRSIGGSSDVNIKDILEANSGGYVVSLDIFSDNVYFDDVSLNLDDENHLLLVKYSEEGNVEWIKKLMLDGISEYSGTLIKTDDDGYVIGGFFDDGSTTVSQKTNYDGFIIKYNFEGERQWFHSFGGIGDDEVYSVIQMNDGSYRVAGSFDSSSVDLGYGRIMNNVNKHDGMIIKFEEVDVSSMYVEKATSTELLNIVSTNIYNDGSYVVGGCFNDDLDLGNGNLLKNEGSSDIVVIKYDFLGNIQWAKTIGGEKYEYITAVTQCDDGGCIVTGTFTSDEINIDNKIKLKNKTKYNDDSFIIKYSFEGVVEWARSIGGIGNDSVTSVTEMSDGGYIVAGNFESSNIIIDDEVKLSNTGKQNGMIIKYSHDGNVEWAQSINGLNYINIKSVIATNDDGYIVVGDFTDCIELGQGDTLKTKGGSDGIIIKYNHEGEIEWQSQIGNEGWEKINDVIEDNDGNYVVCGRFESAFIELSNGIRVTRKGYKDGIVIKYDSLGNVIFAKGIGGTGRNELKAISESSQGGYIVVGNLEGGTNVLDNNEIITARHVGYGTNGIVLKLDVNGNVEWGYGTDGEGKTDSFNDVIETSNGNYLLIGVYSNTKIVLGEDILENSKYQSNGMFVKMNSQMGMSEIQELEVENTRKEFKITTDVKEIENVKGGTISGEDEIAYEKVKYGDSSTKEIKMVPDENYEIVGININGVDYPVDDLPEGEYILPNFDNVTEDKHVVVTYALKENKIVINKVDKETKEKLAGAIFKLDQLDERNEPNKDKVIGNLTDNGKEYTEIVTEDEVTDKVGELTKNGTYYFVKNEDGTCTPTNSKTYRKANGGSSGISSSTANSYMKIDLTGMEGKYAVVVNARCSCEVNSDMGYAVITESTTAPTYTSTEKFMKVSGVKDSANYTSKILQGGKIYYLHFGYKKDSNTDSDEDQIIINNVKLYSAIEKIVTYNFIDNGGKYESTNQGKDNTESCSYIPLDLRNGTGKYDLIINAEISSKYFDYGEVYVTESTTIPDYGYLKNRKIQISGKKEAQDYKIELLGGKMYYIHFRYYKDSSDSAGEDKFTINSVNIELNGSELYHTTVETNLLGQVITQIPFGRYSVTEVKAPDGYVLNETPTVIDFRNTEDISHEFTIEDEKKAKLVVHHYLKGTTTKLAEDETYIGIANEEYKTSPKLDLNDYELEKDNEGNLILPQNAVGTYKSGTTEVTYYYVEKPASVVVHHYYEGSQTKLVEDIIKYGKEGENYTTEPLKDDLPNGYVVVNSPDNATGTFTKKQIEVTYYYAKKKVPLTINKADDEGNAVSGAKFKIYNKYENVLASGELINNGLKYEVADKTNELEKNKRFLTMVECNEIIGADNVDEQYTDFEEKDGEYESVCGYDENGNFLVSYGNVEIDLSESSGKYLMEVEFEIDGGYASFEVSSEDGKIINTGDSSNSDDTFTVSQMFDGGHKYYFGTSYNYYDTNNYCKINSVKIYNVNEVQYGFVKNESGEYVSNNNGEYGTTSSSYMVIDLSDKTGLYKLNIESTLPGLDSGRIDLYDKNHEYIKNVLKIDARSGVTDEENIPIYNKNSEFLNGGNVYILEFKYIKENENVSPSIDIDSDKFIINKILMEVSADMVGETDSSGKVTFMVEPGEYDVVETKVPDGYDVSDDVNQRVTVDDDGANVTVVNRKHKGTVTVHHYIEGTTTPIPLKDGTDAVDDILSGDIDGEYLTRELDDSKSIYTVSEVPSNASGKFIDGNIEVTYYYRLKDSSVMVHYYEEGTTNKLSEDVIINGKINDEYITVTADDIPSEYELVEMPANATGTMAEDEITVIYYYRKKATQVIVHYYEEGTDKKLSEDVTINGKVDDPYTTVSADDVPIKYELVAVPSNANGSMTEETIEVIYYYRVKDAVVNVRYLEKGTDIELADADRIDGKVEDLYQTSAKDIEGYQLVEHTGNERGKFEVEPLTITYYYLYKTKATVQYIDKTTGAILEQSTTEGLEGDDFVTESKDFENYVLVEEPAEKTVKMTKEEQVLKYYYSHVSGGVIEKHIDVISGQILANAVHNGNEGDEYDIPSRIFEEYDLVEDRLPANSKGTMKVQPVEVIYYYIYRTKVTAEYIDKETGDKLVDDEVQDGHEGDNYTTERKLFDGYKLIEVPANADGTMTKDDIKVTYYYVHTSGGVIVNHLDVKTNKQLLDETKEEGYEGDPYETHEENISGYDLVKDKYPENATGTMTTETIRVTYYYIKKTEVNVKYVDKETGEEIDVPTNIPGHEGDDYKTEPKDVPGYDLIEEPENKDGTMTADPIDVIYYYRRPAKVVVNYYDADTKEKLADEIEITGHQNDEYTTEQKDIKYYKVETLPVNKDGKMTVTVTKDENGKEIVEDTTYVNYYYRKLIFNLKVDKIIASVIVNGQETAINGNLGKVEVHRKELSTANVKVVYKIKVTNDSELTGKANVVENIPSGMTMIADNNPGWTINETTASVETDEIKPGESREYQVVLGWQNGDSNIGTKENVASIVTENEAGFEEQFDTDNVSRANLIVAVGTGEVPYVAIAGSILMIMIATTAGIYVIKKKH